MQTLDAYDPRVVFDDVYGAVEAPRPPRDLRRVVTDLVRRASRRRLRVPSTIVGGADFDSTYWSFRPRGAELLGEAGVRRTGLPLFDRIRAAYASATPAPSLVRIDGEEDYADFRNMRRQRYFDDFTARLSDLEHAFSVHTADGHGGHEVVGEELARAAERLQRGGDRVDLPLPSWAVGKVDCWIDGNEILCTVRYLDADGNRCALTSGAPVMDALEEAVRHADAGHVDVEDFVAVVPTVVGVVGGARLASRLLGVLPTIIECEVTTPYVGVLSSSCDPDLAAAMTLFQRCQRGDRRAQAEAVALERVYPDLYGEGVSRLVEAQADKAKRVRS